MRMLLGALTAVLWAICPVFADDTFRVAVGQRGLWDTSVVELGQRGGIFKKYGITLDILYTQGGGETQQAVISGGVEFGVSAGSMGVFGAFAKGAPLRIIGAEMTGGADLFWYVRADSPIRTLQDTDGKTIAYSTNGASTHAIVTAFIKQYGLKTKPVATGGPPGTLTQVMSGQIDVGWAGPPFGLDLIDQGRIRVIASGNDASAVKNQTVRVLITNVTTLQSRQPAVDRFMKAYRETVDWMYTDAAAFRHYAEFMGIGEAAMRRVRDRFYPKAALDPDVIVGIDAINADAVEFRYVAAPLTREQLAELIRIPPR
jgi:ABC-type nitrate/sulfonate/bicarbonate transport system substrate-binding protein